MNKSLKQELKTSLQNDLANVEKMLSEGKDKSYIIGYLKGVVKGTISILD
jgi:hypothetical protein